MPSETPMMFDAELTEAIWSSHGVEFSANQSWNSPVSGSPAFGPVWSIPQGGQLWDTAWSPGSQLLPSPLSELPPYVADSRRTSTDNWPDGADSYFFPPAFTADQASPPAEAPSASAPGQKRKADTKSATPSTKKSSKPAEPNNSKRKRAKPSPSANSSPRTAALTLATSTTASSSGSSIGAGTANASTSKCALGGVLPANVDPRVAAEQIRRAAWQRCQAGAREMLQRRLLVVQGHEREALEREVRLLQANLGKMREAAAARRREEEQEQDAQDAGAPEGAVTQQQVEGGTCN